MKIREADGLLHVEGYVNAVERKSKPIWSRAGEFVERICKGAFSKALKRSEDVRILLNHDWAKDLGGTATGELTLVEDAIGLRAEAVIDDPEVIEKARAGELKGWSFGFEEIPGEIFYSTENGATVRDLKDLNLLEVSLLAGKDPAYEGTLVNVREDGSKVLHALPQSLEAEPAAPNYREASMIMEEIKLLKEAY